MHDARLLREQAELLREGMRRRGRLDELSPLIDRGEVLDRERRRLVHAVEEQQASRNSLSQEVGRLRRAGEDADELVARGREIGDAIASIQQELEAVDSEFRSILLELPNITADDVPAGGEEANTVVRSWGDARPAESVRPHWEIGDSLGILDLPRGAKLSGSGFVVLRGAGARLSRALMNFMLDTHTREHGYEEVTVPHVVNRATMTATGQLPKFEDDMYGLSGDDMFLIPTSEVPVTNFVRDEIVTEDSLPMAMTAYTPCFRREAGSAGKDTRGILRVHQFDKVEMVRISTPDDSAAQLELLVAHAEALLQRLELPYRVVLLASGDTGFASAKTFDLEVFAPGVGKWLEVSSCSNCLDFQARRGNMRFRPDGGGKPRFLHTLNGSGLAFPRVIAALLEHHQRDDGTVTVPGVLRPYLGSDQIT